VLKALLDPEPFAFEVNSAARPEIETKRRDTSGNNRGPDTPARNLADGALLVLLAS
jgi:hypothetical protein